MLLELSWFALIGLFLLGHLLSGVVSSFLFTRNTARLNGEVKPADREDATYVLFGGWISAVYYLIKYVVYKPVTFVMNYGEHQGKLAHAKYQKELQEREFAALPQEERDRLTDEAVKQLEKEFRKSMKLRSGI